MVAATVWTMPQYSRIRRGRSRREYRVPNEAPRPLFVQADFGLDEDLEPQLVEIQGFPSLYAYQPVMAECYREAYGIDDGCRRCPDGLTLSEYQRTASAEAIVRRSRSGEVVLLEIDPEQQKTRRDFVMTEQWFGVRAVDIASVQKRGQPALHTRRYADSAHLQSRHRR